MTDPDLLSWLRSAITETKAAAKAAEHSDGPYTLSWRRGGGRHLTFDNHRSEGYESVFCGNWDRILIARDSVGGGRLATHIALNDPQSVIARCEAELAILNRHQPREGYDQPEGDLTPICVTCADDRMYGYAYPCATVSLLAAGYRHHPGFRDEWAVMLAP